MNQDAVIALQTISDMVERIADLLEAQQQPRSAATQKALKIAADHKLSDDPQSPGEYGVMWIDQYKVRGDNTEGKSLLIDLYKCQFFVILEFNSFGQHIDLVD